MKERSIFDKSRAYHLDAGIFSILFAAQQTSYVINDCIIHTPLIHYFAASRFRHLSPETDFASAGNHCSLRPFSLYSGPLQPSDQTSFSPPLCWSLVLAVKLGGFGTVCLTLNLSMSTFCKGLASSEWNFVNGPAHACSDALLGTKMPP